MAATNVSYVTSSIFIHIHMAVAAITAVYKCPAYFAWHEALTYSLLCTSYGFIFYISDQCAAAYCQKVGLSIRFVRNKEIPIFLARGLNSEFTCQFMLQLSPSFGLLIQVSLGRKKSAVTV